MFILFFNFRAFEIPPLPCRLIMVRLKISLDNHSKLSLEHFNSIMVRLKARSSGRRSMSLTNFNSTKVRLTGYCPKGKLFQLFISTLLRYDLN